MTKKELKIYFWNKLNLCYPTFYIENDNIIIMWVYDKKYIRNSKLYKLDNNKHLELPNKASGKILLIQDFKYSTIFLDKTELWCEINKSLGYNKDDFNHSTYIKVKEYIKNTLLDNNYIKNINNKISDYYKNTPIRYNYFLKNNIPQEKLYLNSKYSADGGTILYELDKLAILK